MQGLENQKLVRAAACGRLVALLLVSWLSWPSSTLGQAEDSAHHERYRSFLWMLDAPKLDARFFAHLDALGVSGTNVAGTAESAPHGRHRRPFYVDHTAGKGTLYLRDETWEPLRKDFLAGNLMTGVRRPVCLASPDDMAAAFQRIQEVVRQARANKPTAYALDDEISVSRRETPLDLCHGDETLARFRRFLLETYGSAPAVGAAWDTLVTDIEEVVPPTTHAIRRREFLREPSSWNLVPWADHREFMERELTRSIEELARAVRAEDPGVPVGFTGGGAPSPFSGLDWGRVLSHVDFIEPYDAGGTRELVRAFARPKTLVYRTLFPSPAGAHINRHELWDYFLRGDHGVILWSSRHWFTDADAARPTDLAKALAPTLKELDGPVARAWMRATPEPAQVAVVESQPSNHLHWMLDSRWEGRSWVHRTTSWEIAHSSQSATREAWQKLLEDARIPYTHVDARRLGRLDLERYKVLILPRTIALSERSAAAVKAFARRGTVIADCQLGLFTERLAGLDAGRLDRLFGVKRKDRRMQLRGKTAKGPAPRRAPAFNFAEPGLRPDTGRAIVDEHDHAAIIERRHGKHGRTLYLNLIVLRYLEDRTGPSGRWLRRLIRRFVEDAGIEPSLAYITTDRDTPLRVFTRRSEDGTLIAVHTNQRTTTIPFEDTFERDSVRILISASKGHAIVPMRTREDVERAPTLRLEVASDEPVIVRIVDALPDRAKVRGK